MTDDSRMKREIEQRVRNTGNSVPPMPDFVRPIFKDGHTEYRKSPPPDKQNDQKEPPKPPQKNGLDSLKMFNFRNINIDNDVILIVVLILILSTDESDRLLLLALAYIML